MSPETTEVVLARIDERLKVVNKRLENLPCHDHREELAGHREELVRLQERVEGAIPRAAEATARAMIEEFKRPAPHTKKKTGAAIVGISAAVAAVAKVLETWWPGGS